MHGPAAASLRTQGLSCQSCVPRPCLHGRHRRPPNTPPSLTPGTLVLADSVACFVCCPARPRSHLPCMSSRGEKAIEGPAVWFPLWTEDDIAKEYYNV